jgi:two-component system, OmpR family, phosphate regulon response regulator PhoB
MPRILIVEDEVDLCELLEMGLSSAGYEVQVASGGKQALRQAREMLPDLIVLDLMLPDAPGIEICRAVRQDPATEKTGVVVVSAKTELLDRIDAFRSGADDYLMKPFSFRELLLRIEAVLRRSGISRPRGAPALTARSSDPPTGRGAGRP